MKESMKNRVKYVIAFVAVLIIGTGAVLGVYKLPNAQAVPVSEVQFEEQYFVGDTLTIPSATLEHGGKTYDSTAIVHLPDGKAMRVPEITFGLEGAYKVEYRAVVDGEVIREYKSFEVIHRLFSVTSSKSSAQYGEDASGYDIDGNGIALSVAAGDRFEFNEVIDLNALEGNSLFKFFVTPKKQGNRDAQGLYLYITDIYDPSNVVTVKVQSVAFSGQPYVYVASYVLAAAPGQLLSGKDPSSGNMHVNNRFGTGTYMSMYARGEVPVNQEYTDLYFDNENLSMSVGSRKGVYSMCEFANPAHFQNLWEGFTTGEVKLSLEAFGYMESSFNMFITNVAGIDLAGGSIMDTQGPNIELDYAGYQPSALPMGLKGFSYPVFSAQAFDKYSGRTAVNVNVYYGYYADTRYEVSISGGRFVTDRDGLYTIVYTSHDLFGNISVKTVDIVVQPDSAQELTIAFSGSQVSSALTGDRVPIAAVSHQGGLGNREVAVTVKNNGQTYEVDKGYFRPDSTGPYTVEYTLTDAVMQQKTLQYTVTVQQNQLPVFVDDIQLPKYLIKGQAYKLPDAYAYDYLAGQYVAAQIEVTGGTLSGAVLTPTADSVIVKYIAQNSAGQTQLPIEIAVVDVSREDYPDLIDVKNYFSTQNLTLSYADKNSVLGVDKPNPNPVDNIIKMAVDSTSQNAGFEFINSLLADGFSFKYIIDTAANNFTSFDIYLTDSIDSDITIKLSIVKDAVTSKTKLLINGIEQKATLEAGFFSAGEAELNYDNKTHRISNSAGINTEVKTTLNGAKFIGFTSEKVYIQAEFKGVSGASAVYVSSLNGQLLYDELYIDGTPPRMKILGEYEVFSHLGNEIEILPVVAADVLSIYTRVMVTVVRLQSTAGGTTETPVRDITGLLLDTVDMGAYKFKLEHYASYLITYTAIDANGSPLEYFRSVTVTDDTPPVITVQSAVPRSAELNKTITLPGATATDNVDGTVQVRCIVVMPDGKMTVLQDNKLYTSQRGTYKIRYYSTDSAGNISIQQFIMVV